MIPSALFFSLKIVLTVRGFVCPYILKMFCSSSVKNATGLLLFFVDTRPIRLGPILVTFFNFLTSLTALLQRGFTLGLLGRGWPRTRAVIQRLVTEGLLHSRCRRKGWGCSVDKNGPVSALMGLIAWGDKKTCRR